jgi:hypothetical protein
MLGILVKNRYGPRKHDNPKTPPPPPTIHKSKGGTKLKVVVDIKEDAKLIEKAKRLNEISKELSTLVDEIRDIQWEIGKVAKIDFLTNE